ncbi:MAG: SDR family oxidoreductase [Saprospiraceae bacterium]
MNNFQSQYNFSEMEWESCLRVLKQLKDQPFQNPDNQLFSGLITKIHKQAKKESKREEYLQKKEADLAILQSSTISKNALANTTLYYDDEPVKQNFSQLQLEKNCYACNSKYNLAHSFYNRLCPTCSGINYKNRFKEIDLTNRNVILTGGRVKIGYATALKFLRANANLTLTTRFPAIALSQLQKEKDYDEWKDNLKVYGLDLRNLKAVKDFINQYASENKCLDILVNNAAQTIKYTDQYYLPILQSEQKLLKTYKGNPSLSMNKTDVISEKMLSDAKEIKTELNRFGNPIDDRTKNSWNSTLEEISMTEILEVNLINQISPYLLIKELSPLMKKSTFKYKFIVNVTSSEGQFSYDNKTIFHPHTNMTKAALNMLTRTSAKEYQNYNILMSAVDVGWVSTGAKEVLRKKQFDVGYIPPLDSVDGAARIMHPIIEAIENEKLIVGKLIKNYKEEIW